MAITKLRALGVTDGTLTNTQINASAAIAKTKLAALDIVNADVNASAAIAQSKMVALAATNMPAGSVVQATYGYTRAHDENVTWNASAGNSAQYGSAIANRFYVTARALTLTPKFSNSLLFCSGSVGWGNGNLGSTGAFGAIITKDDTSAIDVSNYPFYDTNSGMQSYQPATVVTGTFTLSSGSACTIRLRPFGYKESAGSIAMRYRGHSLTVLEIKQ